MEVLGNYLFEKLLHQSGAPRLTASRSLEEPVLRNPCRPAVGVSSIWGERIVRSHCRTGRLFTAGKSRASSPKSVE